MKELKTQYPQQKEKSENRDVKYEIKNKINYIKYSDKKHTKKHIYKNTENLINRQIEEWKYLSLNN